MSGQTDDNRAERPTEEDMSVADQSVGCNATRMETVDSQKQKVYPDPIVFSKDQWLEQTPEERERVLQQNGLMRKGGLWRHRYTPIEVFRNMCDMVLWDRQEEERRNVELRREQMMTRIKANLPKLVDWDKLNDYD
ncbi:hypothetical protein KIPB_000050 [Kipferlia bialata]|uniref:Uncharacterized protein n=1 Tax=Kipferlia bialata TaxID=797122 RepID=A0A391NRF3_9EUKA|nr:hypothetical protein KIPB_000050 [Kipferlia bialata]|eukprot:g50.t1